MTCKGKRKTATLCLAAAVILTCFLAQTIDCYRLKKSERREGRKGADAAKTRSFKEGKIVFGKVFQSPVIDGTKKSSSNTSMEDEAAYQADSAGLPGLQAADPSLWTGMSPSLRCGGDQLKFSALGPEASHFAVDQGKPRSMPLSQVPASCGYSMQKNPFALVMLVPYNGCNMVQEGGGYMLPMRWRGTPVSLWCPKPAAPASTTTVPPHMHQLPQVPHMHQLPQVPHMHQLPQVPHMHQLPQVPHMHQLPPFKDPHISNPNFPPPYGFPYYYPWFQEPVTTPTSEPTTTSQPHSLPHLPFYPYHPFFHFAPPFFPFPTPQPATTPIPETDEPIPLHVYPHDHHLSPFLPYYHQ